MRFLLFILLSNASAIAQNNIPALGQWREHLPYQIAIDVTASPNKIYTATPYSLFSVDIATKEIQRISKVSGLSETGITTIKFDTYSNQLFIAYTNSNIDVLTSKGIQNIPELKREQLQGDKTITHFFPDKDVCYLSTGFGIVVINTSKYEIKETWIIGKGSSYTRVNMFTKDNSYMYAATEEGLKRTPVNTANPADSQQWQNLSGGNSLPAGAAKGVVTLDNKIISLLNDSLFIQEGNRWRLFFSNGLPVTSINSTENKLTVCQQTNSGSRVLVMNSAGVIEQALQAKNIIKHPRNAIMQSGNVWIADSTYGLSQWKTTLIERYLPDSPPNIATGEILFYDNKFYAAAGGADNAWNFIQNQNGVYSFSESHWTHYQPVNRASGDSLSEFITIAIDPRDKTIWAGSFGDGLVHIISDDQYVFYKENTPLNAVSGNPLSYRVSGLAFDRNNNLWISNFGAATLLHVLKADNTWKSFTPPFGLNRNAASQILIDDYDQKWIVSPLANGLLCFNHGASIDNNADDQWRLYTIGTGRGNLPSNDVLSIAKDKNGYIWVGTIDGVGVIQCPHEAFTATCDAVLPIAEQGGFANYLFKGEAVTAITVDGADRKWIGTKNGVWLINAVGDKVLEHFTEDNSKLLSDDIKRIAINGVTGEVFFATAKGISSFKGTATEGGEKTDALLVYPNPVPPGYIGMIAIKGLKQNSFVKITELNGRLVYQTKALGGQAVWNGKNYKGEPIASGVYIILVTDEGQVERNAGRIVFIK